MHMRYASLLFDANSLIFFTLNTNLFCASDDDPSVHRASILRLKFRISNCILWITCEPYGHGKPNAFLDSFYVVKAFISGWKGQGTTYSNQ